MKRGTSTLIRLTSSLVLANLLAGTLSVAYLIVLAHQLSLYDLGRYASVVALVIVTEKIFGFQTWKAIVHFGSLIKSRNSPLGWHSIQVVGRTVDFFGSLAAGMLAFLVLQFVPADVVDFGADSLMKTAVFLPILASGYPTALGILKHSKKLSFEVGATIGGPLFTLLAFLVLSQDDQSSVGAFVIAWTAGMVGSRFAVVFAGYSQFRRLVTLPNDSCGKDTRKEDRSGLISFLLFAKIDSLVLAVRDADVIVVASILGAESTGLYKVARQVSSVIARASSPLGHAFMAVAAEMSAGSRDTAARELALRSIIVTGILMSLILLLFLALGEQFLTLAFGEVFQAAHMPSVLALFAMAIFALAQPIAPLLLTWGFSRAVAGVGVVSVLVYFGALIVFATWFGLQGAVASLILFHVFQLVWLLVLTFRSKPL